MLMSGKATKKIIIANWKMNPLTQKDAEKLFNAVVKQARFKRAEVVICLPYIFLDKLKKLSRKIYLGAQDAFWGDTGAFTGEVSAAMLEEMGVEYVILGHSERRTLGETNSLINKKLKASISAGLLPILCVGEDSRGADHAYFAVVRKQLQECLKGIPKVLISKIIIAYEPVWALSTTVGRHDATPADSLEMALFIRKILSDMSSQKVAKKVRIIYGGSVNDRDAEDFIKFGGVVGLLVGKASLDAKKFGNIINAAESNY